MTGGILKRADETTGSGSPMADHATLQAEIQGLLARTLHIDSPSPNTDLLETGALDSLGIVEVLAELEARFQVHVPMERLELDEVRSVSAMAGLVARLRNER